MKLALFEIDKKAMFPQFFQNLSNDINMGLAWILGKDKNIIYINDNENIKLFGQDFIDITLETSRCIEELKKHYLVFEVAISSPEGQLSFITLFYPHLIVSTCEIELDELFGST